MKLNKDYIIPFTGLKIGIHSFEFNITDEFFEIFDYSIVHRGNVSVKLKLEKKETMLVGDYSLSGAVVKECDRCTEPVEVEVEGQYQLIYKFDTEPSNDEMLVIVYPDQFEIDVKENILELITVSLPARSIHPEGECNEEMISYLDEYVLRSEEELDETSSEEEVEEEIDPRWAELNKLKDKK